MEWIKTDERLPLYQERVLISARKEYENGSTEYLVSINDRRYTNMYGENWGEDLFGFTVTHWMPLPEPPKS